jgi:hypothetical protein
VLRRVSHRGVIPRIRGIVPVLVLWPALVWPTQLDAQGKAPARYGAVTGLVFDSLAMQPLAGATVQLVVAKNPARERTATSDSLGVYRIDSVPAGSYLIGFSHPRLDSLGFESPVLEVAVAGAGAMRVPLAISSRPTLLARICGANAAASGTGLFMGTVRSGADGTVSPAARIKVQWNDVRVGASGIDRRRPALLGTTDDLGTFAMCGVPSNTMVWVRAWTPTDSSGDLDLPIPPDGVLLRDLYIGASQRGTASMRGRVTASGAEPIATAQLVLLGTGIEGRTGSTGQYTMRDLPVGTYMLEARGIGFLPQRVPVDIRADGERVTDFRLESMGRYLDTVKVKGTKVFTRADSAFERRRRGGVGNFLDESAVEQRKPRLVADLFTTMVGVSVNQSAPTSEHSGNQVLMKSALGPCIPTLYVDGGRVDNPQGYLDDVVRATDVRKVEVYKDGAFAPAEFSSSTCGVIVIWTKR